MSDLISREALLDALEKVKTKVHMPSDRVWNNTVKVCIDVVSEQPTVEAVPVVHCKDCKHWGTGVAGETEHVKCCEYGKYMVGENGYCVYGEKM